MKRVTGIGGIFFKSDNPQQLQAWYREHLGLRLEPNGIMLFRWRHNDDPERAGTTVWSAFAKDTQYFNPSSAPFMINYRVEDLDGLLEALRAEGVTVDEQIHESEYGRFGWIMDPEGNRIELGEPPAGT